MMRRVVHRNDRSADQRGYTLVEMAVVLLILSLIIPIVYGLVASVNKDTANVVSRGAANGQAEVMGQLLSRQVHAAATPSNQTSELVYGTADEIILYSSLGATYTSGSTTVSAPTKLDISAALACSGCSTYNLVEKVYKPTAGTGGPAYTSSTTSIIGTGVVVPSLTGSNSSDCSASAPGIFQYYQNTSITTSSCLSLAVPGSGSCPTWESVTQCATPQLSATQFAQVDEITVTLTTLDTNRAKLSPRSSFTLQLELPNVDFANANSAT